MNRNSEPTERSSCELAMLAVACLSIWTIGTGIVMDNFYLAGAAAAVLLLVVTTFMRRGEQ